MEGLVPDLIIGGVSAILGVVLIVEGLKRLSLVSDKGLFTAERAAVVTGVLLGVLAAAVELPANGVAGYVEVIAPNIFGGLVAGLAYDLVGDAFFAYLQRVADAALNRGE